MDGTPRQILIEILNDYRFQIKSGMPIAQALDILRAQVVDLIEYEKKRAFEIGQESGRYGVLYDLKMFGEDHVLKSYAREESPSPSSDS